MTKLDLLFGKEQYARVKKRREERRKTYTRYTKESVETYLRRKYLEDSRLAKAMRDYDENNRREYDIEVVFDKCVFEVK